MKIVITDSGLGGLSVVAELEKRLKENTICKNVDLIFFNSLYSSAYGYNSMTDLTEQAKVFNNALNSIEEKYNPDLILIACNTLSVVFPYTEFAENSKTKIKGILDSGITLFKNSIQNCDAKIILFGTPTTISSNVHKDELIKVGVDETQIVNQACRDLETKIQNNPNSDETSKSIAEFVQQATESIGTISKKTYAGFCCTHYGYSEGIFFAELSKQLNSEIEILNPNNKMVDFLFTDSKKLNNYSNVTVKVVSQVELKKNEIKSLSDILVNDSPKTATAIGNYEYIQNLFAKD